MPCRCTSGEFATGKRHGQHFAVLNCRNDQSKSVQRMTKVAESVPGHNDGAGRVFDVTQSLGEVRETLVGQEVGGPVSR